MNEAAMGRTSSFHLSLGSNIKPERHLKSAIEHLQDYGVVRRLSSVWESHAVGSAGPNFLNVCLEFAAAVNAVELKRDIVDPIEAQLGRVRTSDKNAPRTIDIDIIMEGNQPRNLERWNHVFVVVPMAELKPSLIHPIRRIPLAEAAAEAQATTWIVRHPDVLRDFPTRAKN